VGAKKSPCKVYRSSFCLEKSDKPRINVLNIVYKYIYVLLLQMCCEISPRIICTAKSAQMNVRIIKTKDRIRLNLY
jgi:hypothetical protein